MSKKNTKHLVVKDGGNIKNNDKVKPAKWEDLIEMHNVVTNLLLDVTKRTKELASKYETYVNNNAELAGGLVAISKTIEIFRNDLKEIESLHTTKTDKGLEFRRGEISTGNEKAMIVFLNTAMAYEALVERVNNCIDTTLITFGGKVAEVVEETKKAQQGESNGK